MAKGNDAADVIKREIKRLEQLSIAAEILDQYGSLDNAVTESKKALAVAQKEREEAEKEVAVEREKVRKLKEECKKVKEKSDEHCEAMKLDAEKVAAETVHAAQDQAVTIVDDAKKQAAAEVSNLRQVVESLIEQKDTLSEQIMTLDKTHKSIVAKIVDSESKLADIQKRAKELVGE